MRGEIPKAFIVSKSEARVTSKELISICRGDLADYKCPSQVEFRGELPMKKIDYSSQKPNP